MMKQRVIPSTSTKQGGRLPWRRAAAGLLTGVLLCALALSAQPGSASAHERRTVAAKYTFVVGFIHEPAYVEDANGVSLVVTTADRKPVEGVDKTLKVEVSTAGAKREFPLKVVFNQEGAYQAQFIPTKTGNYTFRFFGTIEGAQINESFESGPNRFDEVVSTRDVQFPAAVPSNGELAAQVRPGDSNAGGASSTSDVQKALDDAKSARSLALGIGGAGLAVGALGLVFGIMALRRPAGGRGGGRVSSEPV